MIVEKALRLAGDQAHLVARPTGRLHIYTGPLTPSGRFIPRAARPVCRAHTRRLEVVSPPRSSSLALEAHPERVLCARCSARLHLRGRAEQHPTTRGDFLATYAGLTEGDIAADLMMATTPDEVDAAAHLSLLLFGVPGCRVPVVHRGHTWPSLHQLVYAARGRVHGFPQSLYDAREREDAQIAAARQVAISRAREARAEREARIERLGFTNATGNRTRGTRTTTRGARP